jgi:lipopolysaccharide export system permease protein
MNCDFIMTILDKYITKSFLSILVFALVAFISIFVIVDFIEKLDDFIGQNVPKLIVLEYYIFQLPYIIVLTLPVAMLLSSLFCIGNLARQNEITAMKASGLSLFRILMPLFILATFVSIGAFFFGEWVVPAASVKMNYITDEYLEKQREGWRKKIRDVYMRDSQDRHIMIRSFDAVKNVGRMVSIQKYAGEHLVSRIDAEQMCWEDSSWILYNGAIHVFYPDSIQFQKFEKMILPNENLTPADFSKVLKKTEEMSYGELEAFIEQVKYNGGRPEQWLVDLYLKISIPFANLIIVLFGAPLSSQKRRGGAATGFGISLAICFIYFGIVKTAQTMGHSGYLSPLVAAWIGNIVFGCAGLIVLFKVPK